MKMSSPVYVLGRLGKTQNRNICACIGVLDMNILHFKDFFVSTRSSERLKTICSIHVRLWLILVELYLEGMIQWI
jgi:hypothetical protein